MRHTDGQGSNELNYWDGECRLPEATINLASDFECQLRIKMPVEFIEPHHRAVATMNATGGGIVAGAQNE